MTSWGHDRALKRWTYYDCGATRGWVSLEDCGSYLIFVVDRIDGRGYLEGPAFTRLREAMDALLALIVEEELRVS
jgi:hypothetical protein